MGVAALISWLVTALFALYLLAVWLIEYDVTGQGAPASRLPALSPLVSAGSHDLLWDARRRGQSLDGVLQHLAGLPAGVVPAQARTGARAGALILPRPEVTGEADNGWALPCIPFGILSIPPVEADVWIEFEQGDPGHLICLGSLWNSPADTATLLLARRHASGDQDQRRTSDRSR